MPLKSYGVLKGRAVDRRLGTHANAHYQVHLVDDTTDYRIAINVKSKLAPSELEYLIDDRFRHPITAGLAELRPGFHALRSAPGGLAVDFLRGNFLQRERMRPLPFNLPGPGNDLNEEIDRHIQRAMIEEDAVLYAFGERWGPESVKDKIFGFLPGNGIHDIHMNQGNAAQFKKDDGVWQDGALLMQFPSTGQWVGVFLKFQSQTWHTDDATGHRIEPSQPSSPAPHPGEPDGIVRIVAAMVNPAGGDPEPETVMLLNTSPRPVALDGWRLLNRAKEAHRLSGSIAPGGTLVVRPRDARLGNSGGIITLLDKQGLKVDGVAYTVEQARREGWTIVF
jgi:uncharacterized protein YukJ